MNRFGYLVAALGAIVIAAPSIASAETVVIKRGDHPYYGAHAEYRDYRGFHDNWRHRHGDRVVIIKKHHYNDY